MNTPRFFRKGDIIQTNPKTGFYGIVVTSPDALFEKLGVEKDPEKLRYYILLDELF